MNKGKPQGSFGIGEDIMDAVNKSKAKAKAEDEQPEKKAAYDSESIPEVEEDSGPKDEGKKVSNDPNPEEIAKTIRKDLGIEITENDLWNFLFKGALEKKGITIVPGMMYATFKTVTMKQTLEVDEKLSEYLEKKLMESSFRNVQTVLMLSQGVIELGKTAEALKSLGDSAEVREAALEKMPSLLVEKLSKKWNSFVYLLNYEVTRHMEGGDGKKS